MYKTVWDEIHKSVCQISFFDSNKIRISSLTGFKFMDYIVTDEIVLKVQNAFEAELRFVDKNSFTAAKILRIPMSEFRKKILPRPKSLYNHIVLIKCELDCFREIPGLNLSSASVEIGQPIAILGFQEDHNNLVMKPGILSSVNNIHGRSYLKSEVTIKRSYRGAPLVNSETCEVIGIVQYKAGEFSKTYNSIKNVVDENVEILESALNKWSIDDIDPVQVLIANQKLVKHFAREIYNSACVPAGSATPVSEILKYCDSNNNEVKSKFIENIF